MIARLYTLVCIVLVTLLLTHSAWAGFFYDGNKLVEAMRQYEKAEMKDRDADYSRAWEYRGYVVGVHDATDLMHGSQEHVTALQICAIVANYLKAHPEKWNEPASDLVVEALKQAFPIKH
jgi:hypothetical protein